MRRFSEVPGDIDGRADQLLLDQYPEPQRDEPVFIAVSKYFSGVYHWRVAWKAYNGSGEMKGWKVVEVIIPHGGYHRYQYGYCFKADDSPSIQMWRLFTVGNVDSESRMSLGELGNYEPQPLSPEQGNADGGCVSCVEGFLLGLVNGVRSDIHYRITLIDL